MENRIAELRAERGWSQQRTADLLGVSRQTVISLERGRFDPSLPLAFNLATLFEQRIDDIFTPEPWTPTQAPTAGPM